MEFVKSSDSKESFSFTSNLVGHTHNGRFCCKTKPSRFRHVNDKQGMFCSADSAELVSSDSAEPAGDEEVESAYSLSGRKSSAAQNVDEDGSDK